MYQVYEFYHPHLGMGANVRGIAAYPKKAEAIAACEAHPVHATVTKAYTSETLHDNGKRNRVED